MPSNPKNPDSDRARAEVAGGFKDSANELQSYLAAFNDLVTADSSLPGVVNELGGIGVRRARMGALVLQREEDTRERNPEARLRWYKLCDGDQLTLWLSNRGIAVLEVPDGHPLRDGTERDALQPDPAAQHITYAELGCPPEGSYSDRSLAHRDGRLVVTAPWTLHAHGARLAMRGLVEMALPFASAPDGLEAPGE